ncbi:biosynthetic peptidoglycan transglycosylase [Mucilaginibacter auburnensis]|uniref:Transglycosylase n=1 Tax=Mucilaginibacter auburnensis TaxID=1457233 RepID=A0A2H9VRP6_9SPHI|nr:biosynthetic peptidoglycan transglycosylase [Mucilaginibacter auburnensis]PJJ83478.1 transglycosylase [Mucilaginibacter auburnensis]
MRRLNPKYVRIAAIVAASLLVILIIAGIVAYNKREAFLQSALVKAKAKAKRDYQLDLNIANARFTGLATVTCDGITIVPEQRDSLVRIDHFEVSVKLLPLILGKVKLGDVNLQNGFVHLTDIKGVKNFDFLFKKKKDTTAKTKADLSLLANNLINEVLYKIPDDLDMKNFMISYTKDSTSLKLLTQQAVIDNGELTSTIKVNDGEATWHLAGKMEPSDKEIDVKLYADGGKVEIPFIQNRYKARINFESMNIKLDDVDHSEGETRIASSFGVKNLLINHKGLSSSDIVVQNGSLDADIMVGTNFVALDSSSVIHLKKMTAHPYLKYTLSPKKLYDLKLNTGWQSAQDIFDSFPDGTFESFEGIKVAGKLNYTLDFSLDMQNPDAVVFNSTLQKDPDFKILKYGRTDLSKLNRPFEYTPYVKGKPVRTMIVGPQNPEYTPLDQISPYLRNAVMTAEDPTFYQHHGFVEEAIRKSIATDIKTKAFKRGGSTMSMQLVKNSFLSMEKTLARKMEEILIVWMIENNNIMTKNRMLEIYFNIIEWGNNIYGIKEAARYYFGKTPAELDLGESIYLASIVPSPRTGLYAFLPDGTLRPSRIFYFNSLGKLMAMSHHIPRDTTGAYGFYGVRLREGLRHEIAPVDSAQAEQILNGSPDESIIDIPEPANEEPEKKPSFFQRLFGGGKKDTVAENLKDRLKREEELRIKNIDSTGKTNKQIRQEKREIKRQEKERRKALEQQGLL